jgi:hypothetical protein
VRYEPPRNRRLLGLLQAPAVQRLADANYELLRSDPQHPSLHFKRVGRLWSVRVGIGYRALAADGDDGPVWFWIGSHAEYDRIVRGA